MPEGTPSDRLPTPKADPLTPVSPANMTDAQLAAITYGCSEFSCAYHGQYNRELNARRHAREVREEGR